MRQPSHASAHGGRALDSQPPRGTILLAEGPLIVEAYVLRSSARLADDYPGIDWRHARATRVDAGIMNDVYRVEVSGRTFFLKQALARVKEHDRLGADLAGVPPARIEVEARALRFLEEALPAPWRREVPRAAWYDRDQNVLWTEEAASEAVSLQTALARGECDPCPAEAAGRMLGAVHGARTGEAPPLWPAPEGDGANWERFLRMRTTGVLAAAELPAEGEAAAHALFTAARRHEQPGMISHLDAAPKNVLVRPDGSIALLDFELGSNVSDPAYDPGFLIGHYLLMGEHRPPMRSPARVAAEAVRRGYRQTGPPVDEGWERRVAQYAGMTMLYRLYGSSRATDLAPERRAAIRAEGIRLLLAGSL